MPAFRPARIKIFISHSAQDRRFVLRLAGALKGYHLSHWYSAEHIRGAEEWHDAIGCALKACNWFLLVLTPAAVRSLWVKRELSFALRQRRYNERIIPLLLQRCQHGDLSWTLDQFEFVDFTGEFEAGCRQLLRIWGIRYQAERSSATTKLKKKIK